MGDTVKQPDVCITGISKRDNTKPEQQTRAMLEEVRAKNFAKPIKDINPQ